MNVNRFIFACASMQMSMSSMALAINSTPATLRSIFFSLLFQGSLPLHMEGRIPSWIWSSSVPDLKWQETTSRQSQPRRYNVNRFTCVCASMQMSMSRMPRAMNSTPATQCSIFFLFKVAFHDTWKAVSRAGFVYRLYRTVARDHK